MTWAECEAPIELSGGWTGSWRVGPDGIYEVRATIAYGNGIMYVDVLFPPEYLSFGADWVRRVLDAQVGHLLLERSERPGGLSWGAQGKTPRKNGTPPTPREA